MDESDIWWMLFQLAFTIYAFVVAIVEGNEEAHEVRLLQLRLIEVDAMILARQAELGELLEGS